MKRMSYEEKCLRTDARRAGESCATYIRHALTHQREADAWRKVLGEHSDLRRTWLTKADEAEQHVVEYARQAFHRAGAALALREKGGAS